MTLFSNKVIVTATKHEFSMLYKTIELFVNAIRGANRKELIRKIKIVKNAIVINGPGRRRN